MIKNCLLALMLAGLIYTISPSAIAQDNGGNDQQAAPAGPPPGRGDHGRMDPEMRTQRLTHRLNLTSDQQAKVLDIFKSAQSQAEALRSDTSLSQEDRRAKWMDIHKTTDDQIRAVLDPSQQKKWDAMQARGQERMQERQNGQAPPAPPADSQPQQPPQ
jgi:periplasmic protein CpxP/Spy